MSHILEFTKDDWHIVSDYMGVFVSHHPCSAYKERDRVMGKTTSDSYPYSWMPGFSHLLTAPTCNWCQRVVPDGMQALARLRMMEKN